MAHFAHVKPTDDTVCSVIVIEQATIDVRGGWPCPNCRQHVVPKDWVQTSYNTEAGVHKLGGTPLRKNYAGIGYKLDRQRDAFVPQKPFDSWILDEQKCVWKAPKERPKNGKAHEWDETTKDWKEITGVLVTP